jgi:HD-GYP domain-containing protein (c-di-GMP phosphodiesterase class II)
MQRANTDAVIASVIVVAFAVTLAALRQPSHAWFHALRLQDYFVIVTMFALVLSVDLVQTTITQLKFTTNFTVSGTVFFAASIGYGAIFGIILAALGTLATELVARRKARKLIFNVAQFVCAAGISGLLYHALVGNTTHGPLSSALTLFVGLLAAAVYLFVNAALVSLVVGINIGKSPMQVFIANVPGLLMQNVTLFSIGLLLTTVRDLTPLALFIALLPLLGPYLAMRGHRDTLLEIRHTIEALADTVDRRDTSTAQHSERVANYTQQIIDELGTVGFAESEAIILAARVHDLGKIAIPDAVLLKPGKLDEGEYWLMRQHPVAGDDILQQLAIYKDSLGVVRHHHERYDGTGYPDGIKGEEIPLGARIVAVADSYDVMTSDRPYARARTVREGIEELIRCKGTHFDPKIVDAFVPVLNRQHASEPTEQRAPAPSPLSSPVA